MHEAPAPPPELPLRIRTERLALREFRPDDWEAVYDYQRQPEFLRFYPGADRDEEGVRAFVQRFIDWQTERPRYRYQLAITLPDEDEAIGNVGVRLSEPGSLTGDLGFELATDYWGRGYATEAARAMLRYGFETLGLHRFSAHCIAENHASVAVLRKIGMRQEGCLRHAVHFKDRFWDVLIFGVLQDD